jgi:hypothetical protein
MARWTRDLLNTVAAITERGTVQNVLQQAEVLSAGPVRVECPLLMSFTRDKGIRS